MGDEISWCPVDLTEQRRPWTGSPVVWVPFVLLALVLLADGVFAGEAWPAVRSVLLGLLALAVGLGLRHHGRTAAPETRRRR